jgi:uncharacterized delta-60 repeat protein
MNSLFRTAVCLLSFGVSAHALAEAGSLDATFNAPYGFKIVSFGLGSGDTDTPRGIAIAASGDITAAGSVSSVEGSKMAMASLNPDGLLLEKWSHSPNSGETAEGFAVVQTSTTPCLVGSSAALFLASKAHTACPQGNLAVTHSSQQAAIPAWLAATASSRMVSGAEVFEVAGATGEGEAQNFQIMRLTRTAAGLSPDPGFGVGGSRTIDVLAAHADVPTSIVRAADSGVYVAGHVHWSADDYDFAVLKLTATGELDASFGEFGPVRINFDLGASSNDRATSIAVDSEQRIIVAGTAARGADGVDLDVAIARLLPDGNPDPAFGPDGRRVYSFSTLDPTLRDEVGGIAVDAQNRVYLIGTLHVAEPENLSDVAILRITEDGELDPSFGIGGRVTFDFSTAGSGRTDIGVGVAMQSDKAVFLAQAENAGPDTDFAVFRLLPGEQLFADGFETP